MPMSFFQRFSPFLTIPLILVLPLVLAACDSGGSSSDSSGGPPPEDVEDVTTYLQDLPSWEEFSPSQPNQDSTATGAPVEEEPVELDAVELVDDDGNVYTEENVVYSCQTQPFTLRQNPEQIAMYSPDREILWAGSLIQGQSHRDGLGSLLGLPIAERAPINVSIPSLANDDNFRRVDRPSQAEVDQAVGSMIGNATRSGLSTPSTIAFEMQTYHSERQSALQLGLSGRYLGYEASASGSIDREVSETTITAQFYQKMYEVVVEPPQSPGDFFSEDFTNARLQQQVDQGRIGPDNLPVYVSNIVYGRMMMFSLTSTASEEEIRATMQAGYESIGGSGNVSLSAKQQAILRESKIKVTSIGGGAQATLDVIRSGNWADYFTDNAELSSASPLSYAFRNLGDGSIASVTETTDYNIRSCTARQATPGTFDLRDPATISVPISTPFSTTPVDVDGDGSDDLVFNHRSSTNEIAIAFSNGDGTFATPQVSTHPDTPAGGWATSDFVTADLENDGSYELIWSRVENVDKNRIYVVRANGRSLEFLDGVTHPGREGAGWDLYRTFVGDMDGDGDDDLVWNLLGVRNRTFVGFSNGDGTFTLPTTSQNQGSTWFPYQAFVGDVTNDNKADMLWPVTTDSRNGWYVGESLLAPNTDPGEGAYFDLAFNERGGTGWGDYYTLPGDIDGQNGTDLIFVALGRTGEKVPVHRVLSDGNGSFTAGNLDRLKTNGGADNRISVRLADVSGEGRSDLVVHNWTQRSTYVGLGTSDGSFDFSRAEQTLPPDDWSQFVLLTGDFNGDGLQDVLWINEAPSSRVYIGLAREDDAL